MPTHQSLGGATDEELLDRMVKTHPERFGSDFWELFARQVVPHLPQRPAIIDLGCGPGLLLRDFGERHREATLHGYDVTPAMLAHGRELSGAGPKPTLELLDVTAQTLPHPSGTVHLVSMSSVLHIIDEPLPVLAEIRRVLAPGGMFLLNDWIRQSLETYLAWRREAFVEDEASSERRGFRLFAVHNKYTTEDWLWLLGKAGFAVRHHAQLRPTHRIFVATPTGAAL